MGPARRTGDLAGRAVVNFGISYALPANYPTQGQSDRVELLGSDGTMIIDDDHMEHLIISEGGIPHPYVLNLKTTYAIERAVATGQAVRLDENSDSFIESRARGLVDVRLRKPRVFPF